MVLSVLVAIFIFIAVLIPHIDVNIVGIDIFGIIIGGITIKPSLMVVYLRLHLSPTTRKAHRVIVGLAFAGRISVEVLGGTSCLASNAMAGVESTPAAGCWSAGETEWAAFIMVGLRVVDLRMESIALALDHVRRSRVVFIVLIAVVIAIVIAVVIVAVSVAWNRLKQFFAAILNKIAPLIPPAFTEQIYFELDGRRASLNFG